VIGVKGVRYRVEVKTPEGLMVFPVTYSAYVRLSSDRRAVHLSRNIEAFLESLIEAEMMQPESLEDLLSSTAGRLLEKHDYTEYAVAEIETTYHVSLERIPEPVDVAMRVEAWRSGKRRWSLSLAITGITACPHAQINISEKLGTPLDRTPTHMQRALLRASIVSVEKHVYRIDKLASMLYKAFSAPTRSLLKKDMEADLIIEAHRNPKLVEDVARDALSILYNEAKPGSRVCVNVTSMESIHPYNVYAEGCMEKMEA